jgi:hypothetical protein
LFTTDHVFPPSILLETPWLATAANKYVPIVAKVFTRAVRIPGNGSHVKPKLEERNTPEESVAANTIFPSVPMATIFVSVRPVLHGCQLTPLSLETNIPLPSEFVLEFPVVPAKISEPTVASDVTAPPCGPHGTHCAWTFDAPTAIKMANTSRANLLLIASPKFLIMKH